jgi:hypothetical protein
MALDTRIPLAYQAVDWGNSLASGLKVANALRGDQLTPAERERLALAKAEFEFNQQNALADNARADENQKMLREHYGKVDPKEALEAAIASGNALTRGQKALQQYYMNKKQSELDALFGGGATPTEGAPDVSVTPVPTQTVPAPEVPTSQLPPLQMLGGPSPAVADPRGSYFASDGQPQGMNRNAAPDGTVITNGTQRLKKVNGKWVPI